MQNSESAGMKVSPLRRPRRSRADRRLTYWLKVLLVVALAGLLLSSVFDFFSRMSTVTTVLLGAMFFTYAVYPAVSMLNKRLPMMASILIVYATIAGAIVVLGSVLVPPLSAQVQSLVGASPAAVERAHQFIADPHNPVIARLPPEVRALIAAIPAQILTLTQSYGATVASKTVTLLFSTLGLTVTVIVIPIISAYLLSDADRLRGGVVRLIPPRWRPKTFAVAADMDRMLSGFVRGQLLDAAIIGGLVSVALIATHVQYGLLIGVLAGVFSIIPTVGSIVAFIPAVTIALINDGWQHALLVGILFAAINQADGNFIAPRIVGQSVQLPPLLIIIALLVGADLGGIGGMFLAVPVAGLLRILALHFFVYDADPIAPGAPTVPGSPVVAGPPVERTRTASR